MKITTLTITIILFSLQLTAQSPSFVGKWVKTKLEVYQNEKLVETENEEINKKCPNYFTFSNNGVFENQYFTSRCEEEKLYSGTYVYKSGLLTMTADGETQEVNIKVKDDKLQFILKEEENTKVIVYFDKLANVKEKSESYYKDEKVSLNNYRNGEQKEEAKSSLFEESKIVMEGLTIENIQEDVIGYCVLPKNHPKIRWCFENKSEFIDAKIISEPKMIEESNQWVISWEIEVSFLLQEKEDKWIIQNARLEYEYSSYTKNNRIFRVRADEMEKTTLNKLDNF